ncbi:MAG: PIN domain-containing protein [Syntrophus sp. (in: bacteria)]
MSVFVDTSAILAVMDADDQYHAKAKMAWQEILSSKEDLVSTNYILVETFALVQNRLGLDAVRLFQEDIVPVLEVSWITKELHRAAMAMLLSKRQKRLSLVDCVSFLVMHQIDIKKAFAFDRHFKEEGFAIIP